LTLLDTNVVVHYLKGEPGVVARIQAMEAADLGIPSVVAYELEYGTLRSGSPRRRELIGQLLADSVHVPFDHEAAREAARIRVELEGQGTVIGPMDLLIAGTATSRGALLVTSNTREFSRVKGLRLADWTSQQ